jgi:hypothetical protein
MAYEYITRDKFERWGAELSVQMRKSIVETAETRSATHATFLSHSSKDKEILPGVIRILRNHGADVYVDKKDATLPPYTNRETASKLRTRISASKKFVLLASSNIKASRWVPWELGLADGYKSTRNVALFPSVDQQTEYKWTEQEYLGIYDRIVWGDLKGHTKRVWMVLNQDANTATELSAWLGQ